MKRSFARIRVVLLLACVPQVVASQGALAQGVELQPGSRARVALRDRTIARFQGKVIETSDDGFTIEVGGEFQPRRVNFAAVESLERSLRVGRRTRVGAVIGVLVIGVILWRRPEFLGRARCGRLSRWICLGHRRLPCRRFCF